MRDSGLSGSRGVSGGFAQTGLFQGMSGEDISAILDCLQPKWMVYKKGQAIAVQGDAVLQVGIILEGKAKIQVEHVNGKTLVLDEIKAFDMFGGAFAGSGIEVMPFSIWATAPTRAAFIDFSRIMRVCPSDCAFHRRLIRNMFTAMSKKLIAKNVQISILKNTTTREKLLAFFDMQMEKAKSREFSILLNRSELADYLGINRSAMSRELNHMRRDGLVLFEGKRFTVLG